MQEPAGGTSKLPTFNAATLRISIHLVLLPLPDIATLDSAQIACMDTWTLSCHKVRTASYSKQTCTPTHARMHTHTHTPTHTLSLSPTHTYPPTPTPPPPPPPPQACAGELCNVLMGTKIQCNCCTQRNALRPASAYLHWPCSVWWQRSLPSRLLRCARGRPGL